MEISFLGAKMEPHKTPAEIPIWKLVCNNMTDMVWIATVEGLCSFTNLRWSEYVGAPLEASVGYGWIQFIHADDQERVKKAWLEAVTKIANYEVEARIRRHDGIYRYFLIRGDAIQCNCDCEHRNVWLGTCTDIDKQKRTETELRNLQKQLSIVTDYMSAAMVRCSKEFKYLWASKPYSDWVGIPVNEIVGSTIQDTIGEKAFNHLMPYFQKVLRGEQVVYEEQVDMRGLGKRWLYVVYNPTYDECGDVDGWVAVIHDIDTRKRAEQATEDLSRRKDEFLLMLAHELRNPLSVIVNGTLLLDANASQSEPTTGMSDKEVRTMILRQAKHLSRLVDDLLDVGRITRGKITLQRKIINVNEAIMGAIEQVRSALVEKHQRLTLQMSVETVKVRGDLVRLTQAIANLLQNASKFTAAEGEIIISSRMESNRAYVSVKDTGVGIRPDQLEYVFDLFAQADPTLDRTAGGMGIGLTLVRNILRMHGGDAKAYSEGIPGRGSEFVLTMPLTLGDVANNDSLPGAVRTVMVVDDSHDHLKSLAGLLRYQGHHVWTATSGEMALNMMEQCCPEVVLLDITLPGMDGYEVARRIREKYGDRILLIAATGHGDDDEYAIQAGFNHYLPKPVEPQDLAKILK